MKKIMLILFAILFVASTSMACRTCQCPDPVDTSNFASNDDIDNAREDMTRENAINAAMASVELDPTRQGFSMGLALGVADFADGDDEIGEAIGLMYGKDNKAVNFKYGRSGSYSAAGVGITVGF